MNKKCNTCGATKTLDEFHSNKRAMDGHQSDCKTCSSAAAKVWREANKERAAANVKSWYRANKERKAATTKAWYQANKERKAATVKAWNEANPDKVKAQRERKKERNPENISARLAVSNAILAGKLVRQPCEVCGATEVHGHHDDYSQPLAVRWMCSQHHLEHHQEVRDITCN